MLSKLLRLTPGYSSLKFRKLKRTTHPNVAWEPCLFLSSLSSFLLSFREHARRFSRFRQDGANRDVSVKRATRYAVGGGAGGDTSGPWRRLSSGRRRRPRRQRPSFLERNYGVARAQSRFTNRERWAPGDTRIILQLDENSFNHPLSRPVIYVRSATNRALFFPRLFLERQTPRLCRYLYKCLAKEY